VCGIVGFTAPKADAREILDAMNAALDHRGPDGKGTFIDRTIALGHTRLAIIDLVGGVQPRVDEATGDALVFNGEIYGYREIANQLRSGGISLRDQSDTEVLFQLIRRDGVHQAIEQIDGMFAFAFRDGATGSLYLVRDRFGEKPLYYGLVNSQLIFGSEVSALQRHPTFANVAPDRLAAYRFLLFEYLPGRDSGWEGINKLEPGTVLVFRNGRVTIEEYWRPLINSVSSKPIDEVEAVERLGGLLSGAVRRRLVADVPVGVFLSGGVDSCMVTAIAAQAAPDITAFTVRFADQSFDETPYAIEAARRLDVRHQIVDVSSSDLLSAFDSIKTKLSEPLADSSILSTYLVCRAARRVMTVALGGDGADELFAGYPNFAVQRYASAMSHLPPPFASVLEKFLRYMPGSDGYMNWRFLLAQLSQGFGALTSRQSFLWMAPFSPARMAGLWREEALPDDAAASVFAPVDRYAAEAADLSNVDRLLYLFLKTYLPEDILTKTDRASMFNGLEVRAPFLDRNLAEFVCALPTCLKLAGRTKKYILKRLAGDILPSHLVHRKKHGFAMPIGRVMRTLLWQQSRDILLSSTNPAAAWFRRDAVEALLAQHAAGREDHGKKLWALLILFIVAGRRRESIGDLAPPRLTASA